MFGLFDDELGTNERKAMANKILTIERPHLFNPSKPKSPNNRMTPSPTLDVFIGPRSWLVFDKLRATGDWLNNAVENWKNDEEYKRMQFVLHNLKVVNDLAERCVKDNASKDREHRDNILIVATDHRGLFQDIRKGSLDNVL